MLKLAFTKLTTTPTPRMPPTFTLSEQSASGGSQYSWRLKDCELRFRGSGEYERLVRRRIPATTEQIASFFAALELMHVWEWRNDYDSNDIGWAVMDGSSWTFSATFESRECRCGGANAYPSLADPKQTTMERGRFALLLAAMYDCFAIEAHIQQSKSLTDAEDRKAD